MLARSRCPSTIPCPSARPSSSTSGRLDHVKHAGIGRRPAILSVKSALQLLHRQQQQYNHQQAHYYYHKRTMAEDSDYSAMSDSDYTLCYWPGIPGRGEFIRLAFEYAQRPYKQNLDPELFFKYIKDPNSTGPGAPHAFAPPILKHKSVIISQTPNILFYIGDELKLNGKKYIDKFYVNELTLTILDLNNEIHDTHHPIAVGLYYEDQKEESKRKAKDVRENRIPKFFDYFNNVIKKSGAGHLVGNSVTYADLALFQVVDGLQFAFPNLMARLEKEGSYPEIFNLKKSIEKTPQIAKYLKSDKREKYSMGVFRHYPELDE